MAVYFVTKHLNVPHICIKKVSVTDNAGKAIWIMVLMLEHVLRKKKIDGNEMNQEKSSAIYVKGIFLHVLSDAWFLNCLKREINQQDIYAASSINLNTLLLLIEASLLEGVMKISPSWNRWIDVEANFQTCCYHLLFFDFCLVKGVNIISLLKLLSCVCCEFVITFRRQTFFIASNLSLFFSPDGNQ